MQTEIAAFAIFGLLLVIVGYAVLISSRTKKAGPNRVLIISGRQRRLQNPITGEIERVNYRIVKGGYAFIWPVVERVDILSLELVAVEISITNAYTQDGIPVTVDGIAQVSIGSDDIYIATAAKYLLSKSETEIKNLVRDVLVHHLQAIVGMSTLEQINTARDVFAMQLEEVSTDDLANMGLILHSLTIKHIRKKAATLSAPAKR